MGEPEPIPAEAYDRDYFLAECEGHEEYERTGGAVLPPRLEIALAYAGPLAGLRILDVGCGRGELVRYGAEHGAVVVGLDYAPAALSLARAILPERGGHLLSANVQALPLADDTFDLAFAFDLVEHLHPPELGGMLREVRRVLKPGGRILIHTMPNLWYYRYGYPAYRLIQRLRGRRLPADPRDRSRRVHVNIQSTRMLARSLRRAGLEARAWLRNTQDFSQEPSPALRRLYAALATVYPLAWIFCNDLFALGAKPAADSASVPPPPGVQAR